MTAGVFLQENAYKQAYACASKDGSIHPDVYAVHRRLPESKFKDWVNQATHFKGYTLLHQVAWTGTYSTNGTTLVDLGADPNVCNRAGETPEQTVTSLSLHY